ncbi:MAG: serine hydrolase, partial [Pseudomonadota bacterium]|nr:serine hydrolase [Pseudomonadota bacterium]
MRHFFKTALTASAAAMTVLLIGCEATGPASSKIGRLFVESHFNEDGTYAALPASSASRPFDEDRLENDIDLVSFLRRNSVHSLIVSEGEDVVLETYLHGHDPETLWNAHGISTTMVSAAVGVALEEGRIKSVDQYISLDLPQFGGSGITWRHLLTMTANLDYTEAPHLLKSKTVQLFSADDFSALIDEPSLDESFEPGTRFHYSSLVAQIMAEGLETVYERPLQDIITDKIWHPMGAGEAAQWDIADATQQVRAGYGLHMTARDLWRFGRFMTVEIEDHVGPDFVAEMRG